MRKQDIKIGMKVVPFRKTAEGWSYPLDESHCWNDAKAMGFLYVVAWEAEENCWVLSGRLESKSGDFFHSRDFRPYVES